MWGDYENETLIYYHVQSKENQKMYHRAAGFHNSLYNIFGLLSVVSSTVASTLSWSQGSDISSGKMFILSTITTTALITSAIQNFYKFQDNSNNYKETSRMYAKIQNKVEGVGNIHPEYRTAKPQEFFKKIQDKVDEIAESRAELTHFLTSCIYKKKNDGESYLLKKHEKYKNLKDMEKLNFARNSELSMQVFTDEESDNEVP
uniref:SMODS and SLOG-associating 2TM effector domain-containing protein n=1 Tax=viral metagenome TaxID=1070528 RepID=A0A6C0L1D4_9ZZZZ|tara:strand:+ start:3006 stop:3614 length:609 start_codon:yes stop_codon:yes gene_type:complete